MNNINIWLMVTRSCLGNEADDVWIIQCQIPVIYFIKYTYRDREIEEEIVGRA